MYALVLRQTPGVLDYTARHMPQIVKILHHIEVDKHNHDSVT